jgi:hypothetical protein
MDEIKLLEECIDIKFTPLETLLLSKTVISIYSLINFLARNNIMEVEKVKKDSSSLPSDEQTGGILIESALNSLAKIRSKIWENGAKEIGEFIPEEFEEIMGLYSSIIETITQFFIASLYKYGKEQ